MIDQTAGELAGCLCDWPVDCDYPKCDCQRPLAVRSWWKQIYRAGIKADLDKQPRTPPDGLTDDQRDVWLSGYDR